MLEQAARLHPDLRGRLQHLPLPSTFPYADGEMDGVIAITVFMHLQRGALDEVAREISRVLKAGKEACLSIIPSRPDLSAEGFDPQGRYYNQLRLADIETIFARHRLVPKEYRLGPDALGEGNQVELGIFERGRS